ncbi:hypothetical protein [Thalassoglobus polymorphus]|uniref:Uncharacterized protein n=1 Tax=Thalassoglobus polymorphus TaxID=2527994 RepID=A0A517QQW1_9PLAN|nr:hypothetical protein [Thalassoglobus polymorphus]QDT34022.1 hypothetical protein Mal48_32790 [Thalassoglobus polymorphus]
MTSSAYATPEDEYWYNVSTQEELPIAGEIDLSVDLESLESFFRGLAEQTTESAAIAFVASRLRQDSDLFDNIRQFLGVSNKRAYLELSYLASRTPHPTQDSGLCGCYPWTLARHPMTFFTRLLNGRQGKEVASVASTMIATYLLGKGLQQAAVGFSVAKRSLMELIFERLIAPKEIQQKAAKRRGHGCEAALARVASETGAEIVPDNRATNPMGANDPHIDLDTMEFNDRVAGHTHAFDLVITQQNKPRILCQSLIHTSDPGQYGVDKSNETVAIKQRVKAWNDAHPERPIELWGLVDGVGFSENKPDTINKLIHNFDHFIQLKTLYKLPLRLHLMGLLQIQAVNFSDFYSAEDVIAIKAAYVADGIQVLHGADSPAQLKSVLAGEAAVLV